MGKSYPVSFEYYIQQFEEAIPYSRNFLEGLDDASFSLKPSRDTWSVAECYSHLIEAGNRYLQKVLAGMERAEPGTKKPQNPMSLRFHMKWFVQYLEPPVSVKAKAPKSFRPLKESSLTKEQVISDFIKQQSTFLQQLEIARQQHIDLTTIKVSNPLIPIIGMTVAECVAVTEAHTRRHMDQAEKVLARLQ